MVNLRSIAYEVEDHPEKVFSRLTWTTERVNNLASYLSISNPISTNKVWIGVLNKNSLRFDLTEPPKFFRIIPLQVILKGRISREHGSTKIIVNMKPGWHTFMMFSAIYLATIMMIAATIATWNTDQLFATIVWLVVFPGLGTYLLYRRFDTMERKLESVLGLEG